MKFVSALSDAQRASLEQVYHHGSVHRLRQRAHAVLLSAKGFTLEQIAQVCEVQTETVSGWFNQWQADGLDGLADAPKSGRRRKIDAALEAELLDLLQNPTPALKTVVQAHLKKSNRSRLGHRKAVPAPNGLHLPPRSAQSRAASRTGARQTGLDQTAPPGRGGKVPGLVRRRKRLLLAAVPAVFVAEEGPDGRLACTGSFAPPERFGLSAKKRTPARFPDAGDADGSALH